MDVKTSRYPEIYARWQRDPTGFWGEAAEAIDWIVKPKTVFDPKWLLNPAKVFPLQGRKAVLEAA